MSEAMNDSLSPTGFSTRVPSIEFAQPFFSLDQKQQIFFRSGSRPRVEDNPRKWDVTEIVVPLLAVVKL